MRISDWSSDVCSSDLHQLLDATIVLHVIAEELPVAFAQGDPIVVLGGGDNVALIVDAPGDAGSHPRIDDHRTDRRHQQRRRRSEERRGGKEGVRTGRTRWSPAHSTKKKIYQTK